MEPAPDRPLLLFFTSERSGPGRRMESLLAHLARKERARLRVSRVDVDRSPDLVSRLGISQVPSLVLLEGGRALARLEGRASAPRIERMLAPHLPGGEPVSVEAA
ncbi:MAG: thioredoxin family protein [Gaiellaceae bacterium]